MKLIKKHQFGGLIESFNNLLKPKYSIDERPTGPTPPAPGWTKMEPFETDVSVKPKIQLSKPSISNTILTDALSVNNNIVTPISKSIFTPYNKFLYDAIFTDADGKPYEYKEVNTNTFNKRFLSPLEASDFLNKKRNQWKQNDFRYALRSQISKHQTGGLFKENLNPPTEGIFGEVKRNLRNGWQQSKRIASSIPLNILLGGIGAGATSVNLANKGKQFANWLVKDENPGLELLSALGWIGSGPAIGVAMFDPFGWTPDKKNEKEIRKYGTSSRQDRIRKQEDYQNALLIKHQEGGQFQEDLTPPSRGLFGEIGTNLQQGNEIFGRMVSSTPVLLLLTGITSGIGGMFGPTMKVSKTAKELVTNPRNAIRKFSRNLNARKGDPTYRWTKTSGNLREGGAHDYQFPGMGSRTRMKVNSAARSEGSGYSAQLTLNTNPTYLRASAPAQTPMQRTWNHQRSVPVEAQASRRIMQRNNLIDLARDWRNYIFESPRFGGANFKVIPK